MMKCLLSKANFYDIRRACIEQMSSPEGVQLPPELITKVTSSKDIDTLFDVLAESPYWSWIDIRLLNVMAAASGCVVADCNELIESYKKSVYARKLINITPIAPIKRVDEEYYCEMITKLCWLDVKETSVANLLDFKQKLEKIILGIHEGICIFNRLESGGEKIHWCIPIEYVDEAYQSASINYHMFSNIQLLWLQIDHLPAIPDLLTLPSATSQITSPLESVGK